ncbi:hypothetical protein MXAN_2161 [Myxococcus xanthus DK 1622]|uniref:Uncharacterized protein n=1 Tax=Myxococcus xanthus (strain DK1622) TaxID=246197 RepID=Q1DAD9_MYXXD|nr:hypothetical protein MXAN_2161 [Myxococcus xanthus DK 1622]
MQRRLLTATAWRNSRCFDARANGTRVALANVIQPAPWATSVVAHGVRG